MGSSRVLLREAALADGTVLLAGSVVALAPRPLHRSAAAYPAPHEFDAFRFARLRADADARAGGAQHAFTALSNDYIVFGLGKHGCPGRFL